jgi:hypothetical protein
MKLFTKRNALVGALVTRVTRRRLERKLNRLAGHAPTRRRLLRGAGIATSAALAVGALFARRSSPGGAQAA